MTNVITIGELLMRLTPPDKQRINQANVYHAFFGGAEANVAINLSRYGHESTYLTALPPNELGDAAISTLKASGVDTSLVYRLGDRLGTYYYEEGFSVKQPEVLYDRKHSSALRLAEEDVEWGNIFAGKDVLHFTGITPALDRNMRNFTFNMVKEAKKRNVKISFDFNYRSKLWSIAEAKEVYVALLPYVDIGFMGYKDLTSFLGVTAPSHFDKTVLKQQFHDIAEKYQITYLACTNRHILSQTKQEITGFIYHQGHFEESNCYAFEVLERIGGGDAFASGVLHGVLTEMPLNKIIEFGVASGVLKHMIYGDYSNFSAEEVERFIAGKGSDINR